MPYIVYKICRAPEWREAEQSGSYDGNADDARDGFVHLSGPAQVEGTLRKHYSGESGLVLVGFDADELPALRWEPSRGGELFPHHYGALPLKAVCSVDPITADETSDDAPEAP